MPTVRISLCRCLAEIGAVDWLPASQYLPDDAVTTISYQANGLCNADSELYSRVVCDTCKELIKTLQLRLAWFVFITLLVLIWAKLFLHRVIPSTPRWVIDASERRKFAATRG